MGRNWGASALARSGRTIPSWSPRPLAYDEDYFWLTLRWGQWAGDGATISGTVALVSGESMGEIAPALLPYPFAGWGYNTDSVIGFGTRTEPYVVPVLSQSGTFLFHDSTFLDRCWLSVSGTLQRELDEREKRTFRPNFVKQS